MRLLLLTSILNSPYLELETFFSTSLWLIHFTDEYISIKLLIPIFDSKSYLISSSESVTDDFDTTSRDIKNTSFKKKVKFGKNVLIGKNVKIGKNCSIGHNSIIEKNVIIIVNKQKLYD